MNISLNGYGTGYVTLEAAEGLTEGAVSYTHLDVYKRQGQPGGSCRRWPLCRNSLSPL